MTQSLQKNTPTAFIGEVRSAQILTGNITNCFLKSSEDALQSAWFELCTDLVGNLLKNGVVSAHFP